MKQFCYPIEKGAYNNVIEILDKTINVAEDGKWVGGPVEAFYMEGSIDEDLNQLYVADVLKLEFNG